MRQVVRRIPRVLDGLHHQLHSLDSIPGGRAHVFHFWHVNEGFVDGLQDFTQPDPQVFLPHKGPARPVRGLRGCALQANQIC